MFYYEQKRYSYCVPATRENFLQVIDNPFLANQIRKIREVSAKMEAEKEGSAAYNKLHNQKSKLKQELPAWVFSAGHIAKSDKTLKGDTRPCHAEWRKSEYAQLNGLVMMDVDHVAPLNPPEGGKEQQGEMLPARAYFGQIVERWNRTSPPSGESEGASSFCKHYGILFVHVTSSGFRVLYDCMTLRQYIQRWAPPIENNTDAYVSSVARTAGVNPDALLPSPRKGRAVWVKIVAGMHLVENGMMPVVSRIEEGWELAFAKI